MRNMGYYRIWILGIFVAFSVPLYSAAAITVQADKPGANIAPTFVGLFIEDINFNGDGGLYAELVKNRSFEFSDAMMGWTQIRSADSDGTSDIIFKHPVNENNPKFLRMSASRGQAFGISNEGFRGMGIRQGESYSFSVLARQIGVPTMSLRIEVVGPGLQKLMEGTIENISGDWKYYTCRMQARATEAKAKLNLFLASPGSVDLDMVSLFPENTARQLNGRQVPGLRKDLVEMLAAVKPGFLRFPGGCIVEGINLANRYQWKNTIGDISDRRTIINRWNLEFRHRLTPDYFQSFGLGFYEYFLLSEQIGAEPMPIINCGMACQFNTGETVAVDKLTPYVQDALDLIEFANGPADSQWGRIRAQMGHPAPFALKYLGVGNEQWGPQYVERYKVFEKALKAKYPEVQLIAATGSDPAIFPNGPAEVKYLWSEWRQLKPDIVDEHFYRPYKWFFENTNQYDAYDPQGSKLFVGEYAAMSHGVGNPENRNNLICALAEAAFMTGFERNASVVTMSAYAPLAGHVDAWQWKPNLLWFDNLTSYGTPNYYVQQMFSLYRGDVVLPVKTDGAEGKLFVSASRDNKSGQMILKVVNADANPVDAAIRIEGDGFLPPNRAITLAGRPEDENSIQEPKKIVPIEEPLNLSMEDSRFRYSFRPHSFTVLKTAAQ